MGVNPGAEAPQASPPQQPRLGIAGLGVRLVPQERGTRAAVQARYQGYLTPGPVHARLAISHQPEARVAHSLDPDIEFFAGGARFREPAFQGEINLRSGESQVQLYAPDPLPELEYFLRVIFALLAFHAGGLLFHSAGVLAQGRAYLFFGPSGTGKTTVARSVDPARVLNDDLVLLRPEKGRWQAHATPFWNPSQVVPGGAQQGPVAGLFRLIQSQTSFVEPMGRGQAVAEVIANTPVISADPARGLALLTRAQELAAACPPRRLHLRLGDEIWPLVD